MAKKKHDIQVEMVPVSKIRKYERNAKAHPPKQVKKIAASIREFGFKVPVLLDADGNLIAGHGRLAAAAMLKMSRVPAIRVTDLAPDQVKAFRIADNRTAESEWLEDMLQVELESLYSVDYDLELSGFDMKELEEMLIDYFPGKATDDVDGNEEEAVDLFFGEEAPKEFKLPEKELGVEFYEWLKGMKCIYVMFSGGKDSMAMLADLLDHGVPKKKMRLVHSRVPLDHKGLDEFVLDFSKKVGIDVDFIGNKNIDSHTYRVLRKHGLPYSFTTRWCMRKWKGIPLERWASVNDLKGRDDIVLCQGFRKEEGGPREHAAKRAIQKSMRIRIARPIADYKKEDVFEAIKRHGWELHPVYEHLDRLGCVYCFAVKRREWDIMRKKMPDAFFQALRYLAEAACSENMKDEVFKNVFRKMMGLGTLESQRKLDGIQE